MAQLKGQCLSQTFEKLGVSQGKEKKQKAFATNGKVYGKVHDGTTCAKRHVQQNVEEKLKIARQRKRLVRHEL